MIGRAPYGHSGVLNALLAAERRGSRQPALEAATNGSAGAAPAGSLGDEREPHAYRREPDVDQDVRRLPPDVGRR
jgi:hypothetical protein